MPAATRVRTTPTEDWESLQLRFRWPEQQQYELIRPVVLFGVPPSDRAAETGAAPRTIARQAAGFDADGFAAFQAQPPPARLPAELRQALRALKAEYPAFGLRELAAICAVRFDRHVSHHTVASVLAEAPLPPAPSRRFAPYRAIASATERRLAVVRLHVEGWSVQSIAGYLGTSRQTVYSVLQRWVAEDFAGLPDKPHTRRRRTLKVDLHARETVRTLQANPELGAFRMQAALTQLGIDLSRSTCGRLMQSNRALYGLPGPAKPEKTPKPMPFTATARHQYWTVDLRYIDVHQLDADPVYCISILENYSRAILASRLSRRQDLSAYLAVLYAALRQYGSPQALVSDGGSIFTAARAKAIYTALGIRHERIARRQPWQSYIETAFNVQRRMADFHFARATSWVALQQVHDRWVEAYNAQDHWAHRRRADGRRSPSAVLDWVVGTPQDPLDLARRFQPVRHPRRLDRAGYVRFRNWRLYGTRALPKQPSLVWLSEETLTLQYGEHPLAYHTVQVNRRGELTAVTALRLLPTPYRSRQPWLWPLSATERLFALPVPKRRRRRRRPQPVGVQGAFPEEVSRELLRRALMAEGTVQANGITLWYETFGDPADPVLLLIQGLGHQGIFWPTAFCERLAAGGRHVIRFDNRDTGHSTWFDENATYTREDMADDAAGLLDALGIAQAHVVGLSMGGMLAQWLAIRHPARVLSLTLMMSEPYTVAEEEAEQAAGRLARPTAPIADLLSEPDPGTREGRIAQRLELYRRIWGPLPVDEADLLAVAEAMYDRGWRAEAVAQHAAAERRTPSKLAALRQLAVPTLVIHGAEDPLIPPDRGQALTAAIPGARLLLIENMGHGLARVCWDELVTAILAHSTVRAPASP